MCEKRLSNVAVLSVKRPQAIDLTRLLTSLMLLNWSTLNARHQNRKLDLH